MRIATDRGGLRTTLATAPGPVALVPTMGNLHAGHLELVALARREAPRGTVIASLFVNPTQFGPGEDFERYPRTFEADRAALAAAGTDVLFAPGVEAIYPFGPARAVRVSVPGLSEILCGASRPGHFDGVATVVTRLFTLVRPDVAVFGQKDFQQLRVIERLTDDLGLGIRIVAAPTVREDDGLAMSSRNAYLSPDDRRRASALHRALERLRQRLEAGAGPDAAVAAAREVLAGDDIVPDYLTLRRASDLGEPGATDRALVALVAAKVGAARLIDNVLIER